MNFINIIMKNIINKYLHLIPVIIMGLTLPYKFTGNALPYLIDFLGSSVVVLIGIQELILIGLLLSKKTRFYGYAGTVLTMLGAIATHFYLGQFDAVLLQAWIVLFASIVGLKKTEKDG